MSDNRFEGRSFGGRNMRERWKLPLRVTTVTFSDRGASVRLVDADGQIVADSAGFAVEPAPQHLRLDFVEANFKWLAELANASRQ
jgi:hypothetical protein